jgi:hypothetical protein
MKGFKPTLTILIVLAMLGCSGKKELKASDLQFESIFGVKDKKSHKIYCLLGTGFFKAPSSDNSDSLVSNWIQKHPEAIVVPVSTVENFTYCWLIEGNDTINNYLIKNGCFPGGTMQRPETYEEMSPEMKSSFGKFKMKVHMDKKSYRSFLKQIESAEKFAQERKLGIWAEN